MENLDVFESVFKRAVRDPFRFSPPDLKRVLVVTDEKNADLCGAVQARLKEQPLFKEAAWTCVDGGAYDDWNGLHAILKAAPPSLIVTHRLLKETHESSRFSLGSYLDTMTQATACPILVLPAEAAGASADEPFDSVLAAADHLSGHDALVNYAAALTRPGGALSLCHVEDEDVFRYYMDTIERIPEINSEVAREKIRKQLLAAPRRYIETVARSLKDERPDLSVEAVVEIGRAIDRYRALIAERAARLLVLESKDETRLAMHGLGYSLAVEFQETPILLL